MAKQKNPNSHLNPNHTNHAHSIHQFQSNFQPNPTDHRHCIRQFNRSFSNADTNESKKAIDCKLHSKCSVNLVRFADI